MIIEDLRSNHLALAIQIQCEGAHTLIVAIIVVVKLDIPFQHDYKNTHKNQP